MHLVLERIEKALREAERIASEARSICVSYKNGTDPVTDLDRRIDECLRRTLPRDGEGWLSEETADDGGRLRCRRVWVVDPLDGTREFLAGIPEWCVSVGLVEDRQAVAGGILNPRTGETFLGSVGTGLFYNGQQSHVRASTCLDGALVLASRSEVERGEWECFRGAAFEVRPMGSVAYKLALVAAGRADASWTIVPKHEWDVAAGIALVVAAGGAVQSLDGGLTFNHPHPILSGLAAHSPALEVAVRSQLDIAVMAARSDPRR
jgi:myo-inositol-1(or 4)-monophosphatase